MKIASLGAGRIGLTVGRLWLEAGHEVTFVTRDIRATDALASELGENAHSASVPDAVRAADVVLVAIPGPAVIETLQEAGSLDGKVVIHAANLMQGGALSLRTLSRSSRKPGSCARSTRFRTAC